MKKDNSILVTLWIAGGLSLLVGTAMTVHTFSGLSRWTEISNKKAEDARDLAAMRDVAAYYRMILKSYEQFKGTSTRFDALVRATVPAVNMVTRSTERQPAAGGWTAQRLSIEFTGIGGDELARILDAGAAENPPWTLLECSLFASPTPGRLAKAELVMGTVERQQPAK